MFRHHLRTAFRSLRRDRFHSALGGLSLAVAIAACILIALFIRDELSYDRNVPNVEQIVALGEERARDGDTTWAAFTYEALAGALVDGAPEVEAATTTWGQGREMHTVGQERHVLEGLFADSLFFDVFAYPFLAGDPATALDDPDGLVLTESAARRVFGGDAMGQSLDFAAGDDTLSLTVRGIVADVPEASSVTFEAVLPLRAMLNANPYLSRGWGGSMYTPYARLRPGTNTETLQASLDHIHPEGDTRFVHVPLIGLRLSEMSVGALGFGGSRAFLRIFGGVALLILILGAVNTVNLATARGARRAQEVGVRKALGSSRGALIRQFLTESTVLTTFAALLGVGLSLLVLPWFNEAFVRTLSLSDLDAPFFLALVLATVVIGLVAGFYPAVYLSRFDPDRVLRGTTGVGDRGGALLSRTWLRRGLVVFQFGVAVLLLVGTAVMSRQLDYVLSSPLGFEPERVVVVPVTDAALQRQPDVLKRVFLRSPAVEAVSGAGAYPTRYWHTSRGKPDPEQPDLELAWKSVTADADYARVLGLDVVAGRWPQADRIDDMERGLVLNAQMVRDLGWQSPEAALGRQVTGMIEGVVVGVVGDYHFTTFRDPVEPVIMHPDRIDEWRIQRGEGMTMYTNALVRFAEGREQEGLADIEAAYAELAPEAVFEPIHLDQAVEEQYTDDLRLAEIFAVFAGLAILIACLGLIGLAAYSAQRRTKEIGVRRVLGATVPQVVSLLSREYVALALAGTAVAVPLAVILVQRWLETFAYRTSLGTGTVALVVLAALALATATVAVLSARAATADPMRSLRTE